MDIYKNINVSKDILLDFFVTFSRFEFSLKAAGYRKKTPLKEFKNDAKKSQKILLFDISADWDTYAQDISHHFNTSRPEKIQKAVEFFTLNPIFTEVMIGDDLGWSSSSKYYKYYDSEIIRWIIPMIKRIRNNLFHGGNFNKEFQQTSEMIELFLQHSLIILEYCLTLELKVKDNFENASM